MADLYPTLSQITAWGVGDIDECSILATYWAARAAGFVGELPSIAAFRSAAGRPDRPGPTGLTNAQVWQGIMRTDLRSTSVVMIPAGASWSDFVANMKIGGYASLAVNSALLPANVRFGFFGGHRIGATLVGGQWFIANPLAPDRSAPVAISEADLRAAVLSFGGGSVEGIIFAGAPSQAIASAPPILKPAAIPMLQGLAAFETTFTDARTTAAFYRVKHPLGKA